MHSYPSSAHQKSNGMDSGNLQQQLFQQIKSMLPTSVSFPDAIAHILHIRPDSAYRRIRGEKSLSFDEIQKLSKHFNISLDKMLQIDFDSTVFYRPWLKFKSSDFEECMKEVLQLARIACAAQRKLTYNDAKDLPLFFYFHFPQLAAFKHFFWMKTVMQHPDYAHTLFEDKEPNAAVQQMGSELLKAYNQIPSVEIWHAECIDHTLHQLVYARKQKFFRADDTVSQLFDQFSELIEHIHVQAEYGEKMSLGQKPLGRARFELYRNEAYLGNNTVLTEFDGLETVYINQGTFQLMYTNDADFCDRTRKYFEQAKKKSVHISEVNPHAREMFFHTLKEKIAASQNSGR
jgi:hypothetical protein